MCVSSHTLSTFQKSSFESSSSSEDKLFKSVSSSMLVVKLTLMSSSKSTLSSELADTIDNGLDFLL